jgi:hypothetical protein
MTRKTVCLHNTIYFLFLENSKRYFKCLVINLYTVVIHMVLQIPLIIVKVFLKCIERLIFH